MTADLIAAIAGLVFVALIAMAVLAHLGHGKKKPPRFTAEERRVILKRAKRGKL